MEQSLPLRRLTTGFNGSLFAGVGLFLLAVIVFVPAFHGGFLWNDDQLLTANPQVHAADGWWGLWLRPQTVDYFPVSSTTFWAEWRLWGMRPYGYHVTNVLLHGVVVLLTWQTLKRLAVPGAWVAAAIFAVHPVCVESVAWIAGRVNLLSQIFFLLSIMSFLAFEETGKVRWYGAAFVCFVVALLSKTSVVMLPVILMLLVWWRSWGREPKREWYKMGMWMMPFFAVALVLGLVTIYFGNERAIGDEIVPNGNALERVISAEFAAGFYLYSALWPFNVSPVYPEWTRVFSTMERFPAPHMSGPSPDAIPLVMQAIPGVLIVGVLIYCWVQREKAWARAMFVGLGCYFVALLPALGLVTMSYMRMTLVADHFQYVSIAAVIALVVAGGYQCAVRPVWLVGAGVVFGLIAWLHWGETRAWHVQEVIWAAGPMALALIPGGDERVWRWAWNGYLGVVVVCFAPMAWSLSGNYQNEGKYFTAVLEKNPNCWQAYNHLGAWLYMNGDIEGSLPMFKKATELKPENPESHNNLGLVFSYFGATEDAIGEFKTAVSIKDDSAMDTNLANAYEEAGRYPEAVAEYKHAIELSPQNASAWCNMGYALMREGKTDDAIPAFMKAIEYDPGMLQGRTDLYQALKMRGIDPDKPPGNGTFPFDLKKALELLKEHPPDPKVVHGK